MEKMPLNEVPVGANGNPEADLGTGFEREQEATMESARGERAGLLREIFSRRKADITGNFVPGIDVIKLGTEAAVGKTFSGKELSGRERVDQAVISGVLALAYTLHLSGMHPEAMKTRVLAATIAKVELGPEFLHEAAEMAAERFPKTADLLRKTGTFFQGKRKQILDNSAIAMHGFMMGSQDLIELELEQDME